MNSSEIRFVSSNSLKIAEATQILSPLGVTVIPFDIKIEELQTVDTDRLVKDKALKAFKEIGRPLFVEHTGLYIEYINGLPGGLTQIIWDALKADRFSEIFGNTQDTSVRARTTIGFIDGKKIEIFKGDIAGKVSPKPRGNREFQWDCVFIPEGYTETFAEMGPRKNEISMRRMALDVFVDCLKSRGFCKCII